MHPAYSIIVFTTLSGLGYGLAGVLGLGLIQPDGVMAKSTYAFALILISAGLLSSTLHLGNPQRSWRALSQWRSSWLSREGVMAIVTFVPLCILAALAVFESEYVWWAGIFTVMGALVTVYCTSMIYASLKSVQVWHTPLTPLCYLLFSAAGGCLLGILFGQMAGQNVQLQMVFMLVFMLCAWGAKVMWRRRLKQHKPLSTPESATGLGHIGKVRLFESPHVNDNYLTREMGFRVARKHADKLFAIAIICGGIFPVILVLAQLLLAMPQWLEISLTFFAIKLHLLGILSERWLFFAEARHAVMAFYER